MSEKDKDYSLDDALYDDYLEDDLEEDVDDFDIGGDDIFDDGDDEDRPPTYEEQFGEDELEDDLSGSSEDLSDLAEGKKRSGFNIDLSFNAMAIIGALVLGIGVLAFQIVTKKPPEPKDVFVSSVNMSGASDGPVFGDPEIETRTIDPRRQDQVKETKGFLYEPDILDGQDHNTIQEEAIEEPVQESETIETEAPQIIKETVSERIAQVPVPEKEIKTEIVQKDNLVPIDDFLAEKPKPVQETKTIPAPVAQNPDINEFKDIDAFVKPAAPEPAVQPVVDIKKKDEALKAARTQLESMAEKLKRLEAENKQLKEKLLEEDKKTSSLQEKIKNFTKETSNVAPVKTETQKPVSEEKPVVPKPKETKQPAEKPKTKQADPVIKSSTIWELRAAQPGKAWISKKGARDMITVTEGQTIQEIGTIQSIVMKNNRWTVIGSQGRIKQ